MKFLNGLNVSGNVGIGTNSPSQKLDVQGDISTGVSGATTVHTYYNSTTRNQIVYTNNSSFEFHEGVNERVRIAAGGNVGIGTTSPSYKLDVFGNGRFYGDGNHLYLTVKSGATDKDALLNFNNTADRFALGVAANTNNFSIASSNGGTPVSLVADYTSGNVGIGTTSPASKLDITDTSRAFNGEVGSFRIADAANANKRLFLGFDNTVGSGAGYIQSIWGGTAYLPTLINPVSGNVLIGTTTDAGYKLDVNGTARFSSSVTAGGDIVTPTRIAADTYNSYTGGSTPMIISTGGLQDVIIKTNATTRLTVASTGTATFSNNLVTTNGITDPAYARITSPGGGISVNNDPQNAAIKIALPANGSFTNTMISFTVHIYEYASGKTRTLKIAGYTYFNQEWYNMSVYQSGGELIGNINVRFGIEDGRNCVWIGETNTYWSYPNIFITDVQCGHVQIATLTSGWSISLTTTLGTVQSIVVAYTNITTKEIGGTTNYVSKFTGANTLGNSLIFDNGTNVGIGTTSPTAPLEIINTGSVGGGLTMFGNAYYGGLKYWGMRMYGIDNGNGIHFSTDVQAGAGWYSAIKIGHGQNATNPSFQSYYTTYLATTGGNVGIGTTSPGAKLTVSGAGVEAHINNGDTNTLTLGNFSSGRHFIKSINLGVALTPLTLQASSFTFDTGNVGIGTTSPGYNLDVSGDINFSNTLKFAGTTILSNSGTDVYANLRVIRSKSTIADGMYINYDSDGGANADIRFYADGQNERMRIDASNGNVGIGTASPGVSLDVSGSGIRITNATPNVYFNNTVAQWKAYLPTSTNNFAINDAVRDVLTLGYNGAASFFQGCNVGIGTTAPITKISIGSYSGSRLPYINGTANTFDANGITVTSSNTANAAIGGGIDLTNNVHSVGSFSPLISFSALSQSGTYNNNYAAIYGVLAGDSGDGNWNSGHLVFATALAFGASEKMRITNAGNVGIGTVSPSHKLDVSGTGRFTEGLSVSGGSGGDNGLLIYQAGGAASLPTYTSNSDRAQFAFKYAQNFPSSNNYTRTLDIVSTGDGTGGGMIRLFTTVNNSVPSVSLTLATTGAATFSNALQVGGQQAAANYGGTGLNFDFTSGNIGRIASVKTTSGGSQLQFFVYNTSGADINALTIASTGAATFSSSVAATSGVIESGGFNIKGTGGVAKPSQLRLSNASDGGYYWDIWRDNTTGYLNFGGATGGSVSTFLTIKDVSGNVGIGTTSPAQKLDVDGSVRATGGGFEPSTSAWINAAFTTKINGSPYGGGLALIDGTTGWAQYTIGSGANLVFAYGATSGATSEKMRITSGGDVGIGTATPSYKLDVNGTGRFGSDAYSNLMLNGTNASGWGNNIAFQSGGTDFGYVGSIGSLLGNTTKDMTIWSTAGNGFRVYTNGNNKQFEITSTGAATFSSTITATGGNSTQWNTAYSWGNHAAAGYWEKASTDDVLIASANVTFHGNVTVEGIFTETSSREFKENILPLEATLERVNQLEPVTYNKIDSDVTEVGLIAEDVASLFPEVVTYNEQGEPTGIQYQRLSVILLKSVQELTERIIKLENK